jgi:hypothetical protein
MAVLIILAMIIRMATICPILMFGAAHAYQGVRGIFGTGIAGASA